MASKKKLVTYVGGVIVLILGIISFVFLPAMMDVGKAIPVTLGKWGNISIRHSNDSIFTNNYRNLASFAEQQKLVPEGDREFFYESLAGVAFKTGAMETAMISEVENAGYTPSEFRINKELINYYLDENGIYSDIRFSNTSESLKMSYRKSVENFLKTQRYIEDLFGTGESGGLKMSAAEKDFIKSMAEAERSFKYVAFDFDSFPKEEIQKYGQEHENLFLEYDFSALTFENEDEAKKVLTAIQNGEKTFETAVEENQNKVITDENGKLEKKKRTDINRLFPDNSDLEKAVNLKSGEISSVLKTNLGSFAILRCDALPPKPDFSAEEMITEVFSHMKYEERGLIEDFLMKKAEEFYADSSAEGFEKAAKKFGKESVTSNSFAVNYGGLKYFPSISAQKDSVLTPAIKNEEFYKAVFSLKDKEISKPILLGSTAVVLTGAEEKKSDDYTKDNAVKTYESEASGWNPFYQRIMLLASRGMNFYTLPLAQNTFTDFVLKNPKLKDNHRVLFRNE